MPERKQKNRQEKSEIEASFATENIKTENNPLNTSEVKPENEFECIAGLGGCRPLGAAGCDGCVFNS